jgi:hypothetical protein
MTARQARLAISAIALATALGAHAAGSGTLACGGVGNDERRELAAAMRDSNLSLQFSLAGRGNYVAGVDLTITPAGNAAAALTATTDGPICYVRLPPGRYRVDASYNGTKRSATANVAAGGKSLRLAMAFPPGADEIDPAPVSPEEKLQASKP